VFRINLKQVLILTLSRTSTYLSQFQYVIVHIYHISYQYNTRKPKTRTLFYMQNKPMTLIPLSLSSSYIILFKTIIIVIYEFHSLVLATYTSCFSRYVNCLALHICLKSFTHQNLYMPLLSQKPKLLPTFYKQIIHSTILLIFVTCNFNEINLIINIYIHCSIFLLAYNVYNRIIDTCLSVHTSENE
jgi:hypothetical protein